MVHNLGLGVADYLGTCDFGLPLIFELISYVFLSSCSANTLQLPMHEVTFSTIDKPKLLSQVFACLDIV